MNYTRWIDSFMNAWKNRDVDIVMKTIAPDCKYFESVFAKPCSSYEDIKKLWKVVPKNQRDISYHYTIIAQNNIYCIVNFNLKRTLIPSGTIQEIDGIFQISLNDKGECTFFKQWRSIKEE